MKPSLGPGLPMLAASAPETVRYSARPGLGALPEGGGALLGFAGLQLFPMMTFLWAVWWPTPSTPRTWAFAIVVTTVIVGAGLLVFWLLFGRQPRRISGLALAPFIRLTVTDRRVLWTLPWRAKPLFEIASRRVLGGLLGEVDRSGQGAAAIMLEPGDPAGDAHGHIHFDRLPDVTGFVDALGLLA